MKIIELTRGHVAKVDDEDFEMLVSMGSWHASGKNGHIYANHAVSRNKVISHYRMHRVILNVSDPKILIDHENHDTLDNQKRNLRIANRAQNGQNRLYKQRTGFSSQFKGVSYRKQSCSWEAKIQVDGKHTYLGMYHIEADAAKAYDTAALKYFGEFACTNFENPLNSSLMSVTVANMVDRKYEK